MVCLSNFVNCFSQHSRAEFARIVPFFVWSVALFLSLRVCERLLVVEGLEMSSSIGPVDAAEYCLRYQKWLF